MKNVKQGIPRGAMGFAAFAVAASLASMAVAQQQPVPLSVKKISDDVYWTQGGAGGNTGIIIGKDGVIVVDAKTTADSARQVLAEIAKLTPKPVTTVILTHSDGDHVNGLAAFPLGLTIIAQENCKKEIEATSVRSVANSIADQGDAGCGGTQAGDPVLLAPPRNIRN